MDTAPDYDVLELRATLTAFLGADIKYYPTQIEQQFPRILSQIVEQWGKPGLDAYLSELMLPERPGRQGFPSAIAMEIFHLANLHSTLTPSQAPSGTGWSGVDDPERYKKALSQDE